MIRLTLRDKHILRRMMVDACSYQEHACLSYIEAAERSEAFELTLKKIVPLGRLPELKKPLWRTSK